MSYILNALKKAERDRRREDPQDLNDFASAHWDPYQPPPQATGSGRWLLAVVLLLLGLVLGGFFSGQWMQYLPANQTTIATPLISEVALEVIETPAMQNEIQAESTADISESQTSAPVAETIPDFRVAGHMFITEGSSSNRLFINDRSFREGDALNKTWTLVSIKPDNFVIKAGNRTEILSYR
jgi:hypothetical protein|tara:strand:- start:2393 stop:2941 length:549 start_codon:yes stop_codon:yes gene_type:complete